MVRFPALLELLSITDAVASESVTTTMEKLVHIRLCNFSTSKPAQPKGACLAILVEAYAEDPTCSPEQIAAPSAEGEAVSVALLLVGRLVTVSDLLEHPQGLVAITSETLTEGQQQHFIQLLLTTNLSLSKVTLTLVTCLLSHTRSTQD